MSSWLEDISTMVGACHCADRYHEFWGILRLAGYNIGLFWEAEQLRDLLSEPMRSARNILVAGSADHLILALLDNICGDSAGKTYRIVDRCPAPLILAERYARDKGLDLTTWEGDLNTPFPPGYSPDLVFMHYTLNLMTRPIRASVLANIASALSPSGRVIISHRSVANARQAEDARAWMDRVLAAFPPEVMRASVWQGDIEHHLRAYAESKANRTFDGIDNDTLLTQVAEAGLQVLSCHPTVRSRMLADCPDQKRAQEHSTIYLLGHA